LTTGLGKRKRRGSERVWLELADEYIFPLFLPHFRLFLERGILFFSFLEPIFDIRWSSLFLKVGRTALKGHVGMMLFRYLLVAIAPMMILGFQLLTI
jgi:hypothetical protein